MARRFIEALFDAEIEHSAYTFSGFTGLCQRFEWRRDTPIMRLGLRRRNMHKDVIRSPRARKKHMGIVDAWQIVHPMRKASRIKVKRLDCIDFYASPMELECWITRELDD